MFLATSYGEDHISTILIVLCPFIGRQNVPDSKTSLPVYFKDPMEYVRDISRIVSLVLWRLLRFKTVFDGCNGQ